VPRVDVGAARRAGIRRFGDLVTYQPRDGDPFSVSGVFTAPHETIDVSAEATVSSNAPVLGVNLADFPSKPRNGDHLIRAERRYRVVNVKDDGEGGAALHLQNA
jgi:hypothetical protein